MTARFPYDTTRRSHAPVVSLTLTSPDFARSLTGVNGLLDTGADDTILPASLAAQLQLVVLGRVLGGGFGGQRVGLDVVQVIVQLPGAPPALLDVAVHPNETFVLVGRDFLNLFRVTFDGPNDVVEFH